MTIEEQKERIVISRLVFLYILIFLMFRFFLQATPSHFLQPPLALLNLDLTYWLYTFLRIPAFIIYNQAGAVVFDALLFLSCLLGIVFPLKRIFTIPFSVLFLLYAVSYNTFIVSHSHPLAITMLITVPFWFKKITAWKLMWQGMRYYICYVYTMSFIWKIWISDAFFNRSQGVSSVKKNVVEYMYHHPDTFTSLVLKFFTAHPLLLTIGSTCVFLLEGLMVIGFFTKKHDKIIMMLPVIIHLCTYLFADVFFLEMLVLVFAFFTRRDAEIIAGRVPLILKQ